MKFRGAGQGPLALVAEIIAGELARRLGLRVPELVLAGLDPRIGSSEPDPEIQDLLRASAGLNLGVEHVLGDRGAAGLGDAHAALAPQVTETLLQEVAGLVPPEWFGDRGAGAYVEYLALRAPVVPEVIRR